MAKREGIAVAIAPAFRSINSEKAPCPHFHAALSRPPSPGWTRRFCEEFGPRAVDVREIGTSERDPERLARYHSKQSTSITVAYRDSTGKVCLRTSALDDAGELVDDLEQAPGPDPASSDEPDPTTPTPHPDPLPEPGTITREEAILRAALGLAPLVEGDRHNRFRTPNRKRSPQSRIE